MRRLADRNNWNCQSPSDKTFIIIAQIYCLFLNKLLIIRKFIAKFPKWNEKIRGSQANGKFIFYCLFSG